MQMVNIIVVSTQVKTGGVNEIENQTGHMLFTKIGQYKI
jgi:hypothetical protein